VFTATPPTKGRLLLATPPLVDENFDRSVVFVLEHHEEGAIGLVINRPSGVDLVSPLDRWGELQSAPETIFTGGPVETSAMIGLGKSTVDDVDASEHSTQISGVIVSTDLSADPAIVAAEISEVRIFRGYAGWGAGQLESEIGAGGWIVVDAEVDDVFSAEPTDLWHSVLRRQPGRLAWLANAPDDLSFN